MWTRRTVVEATALAGVGLLAGCLEDDEESADEPPEDDDAPADADEGGQTDDLEAAIADHDPVDRTDAEEVTIDVAPDGELRFDPEAVLVEQMTTITWRWPEPGYEIYPIESPDQCGWAGDDHGSGHSWEFPFVGTYEIGCTTPDDEEFTGHLFVTEG
ncbi:hypothetical protein [Natrarchaeobaculum aegyptiacum]|uniref:Plastocyanin n=1 Tax=Natrarchaeobaculum aegyptiacum TaxID=745377 RepID=A0A2Z2HPY3_9EURY|nr:hypothetical protein [Natrarchaeobaculum aegyptiacum]ARS89022.1 hypothetical protein B1756_04135 [Natrarchaeobaculum aegyptiacum]